MEGGERRQWRIRKEERKEGRKEERKKKVKKEEVQTRNIIIKLCA